MIHELLQTGKQNALATSEIMKKGNFRDARAVAKQVQIERQEGYLIMSTTCGGYYLPADRTEVEEFISSMTHRAECIFISIAAARKYLETIEGQQSLEGLEDYTAADTS